MLMFWDASQIKLSSISIPFIMARLLISSAQATVFYSFGIYGGFLACLIATLRVHGEHGVLGVLREVGVLLGFAVIAASSFSAKRLHTVSWQTGFVMVQRSAVPSSARNSISPATLNVMERTAFPCSASMKRVACTHLWWKIRRNPSPVLPLSVSHARQKTTRKPETGVFAGKNRLFYRVKA